MADKLFNHCPNCYVTYDKNALGYTIMECNSCRKSYCWNCNEGSNIHRCKNGGMCNSSSILGVTKSKVQRLQEIERDKKEKKKRNWW